MLFSEKVYSAQAWRGKIGARNDQDEGQFDFIKVRGAQSMRLKKAVYRRVTSHLAERDLLFHLQHIRVFVLIVATTCQSVSEHVEERWLIHRIVRRLKVEPGICKLEAESEVYYRLGRILPVSVILGDVQLVQDVAAACTKYSRRHFPI